jgi:hypothetical protein
MFYRINIPNSMIKDTVLSQKAITLYLLMTLTKNHTSQVMTVFYSISSTLLKSYSGDKILNI